MIVRKAGCRLIRLAGGRARRHRHEPRRPAAAARPCRQGRFSLSPLIPAAFATAGFPLPARPLVATRLVAPSRDRELKGSPGAALRPVLNNNDVAGHTTYRGNTGEGHRPTVPSAPVRAPADGHPPRANTKFPDLLDNGERGV